MQKVKVMTARDAADLINDGDVLTVSSSSGLGCPDAILAGIGLRFLETNSPVGLTSIHPIAAGDMYGIKGIDHIARPGLLKKIIAGSYPSGPSRKEPPLIWQMIEKDQVAAYNFPSGVLFQMHRAVAVGQPGVMTHVGTDTFIDPRQMGGRMNETTPADHVEVVMFNDEEWLFFPSIKPNVAIIRATTADEFGNLTFEDEGSPLGALDQAYSAHNNGGIVIAQVKRLAQASSLDPQKVKIPGILVDFIVLAPDQLQTTMTMNDPTISGQLRRPLEALPKIPFSLEKITARRATEVLFSGDTVNLGFGVSALVPHILVEEGISQEISWVIEQGAVGGVPLLDFAFGCAQNPDAIMSSSDQFTLLQGAGFDHTMLSFLEIDKFGNVNVHYLPNKRHVTAGVGGFADITSSAKSIVFIGSFTAGSKETIISKDGLKIVKDAPHTKLVNSVSAVTFSGHRAIQNNQRVTYVTERCVMKLTQNGIMVTEIAPGIDLQRDILDRAEFPLLVSDKLAAMNLKYFQESVIGLKLPIRINDLGGIK